MTPMDEDGGIDRKGLECVVERVRPWVDGYVVMGTTGEPGALEEAEQEEVIRQVVDLAGGKAVVVGVGGEGTSKVCRRVERVANMGVDGVLAVVPYYVRPPLHGIIAHYKAVAAVGMPVLAYNVPYRTGVDLAEAWAEIAEIEGVVGVKQACGDLGKLQAMVAAGPVWCGEDDLVAAFRVLGGQGVVSAAANVYPEEMRRLAYAPLDEAGRLQVEMYPALRRLYKETNPIGIKRALNEMGVCTAKVRAPLA